MSFQVKDLEESIKKKESDLNVLKSEEIKLQNGIRGLKKDIEGLKKEIQERDETIQDKVSESPATVSHETHRSRRSASTS